MSAHKYCVDCSRKHDEDESKFLCFRDTASLQSTETHLTFLFRAAECVVPFSPLIRVVGKVGKPPLQKQLSSLNSYTIFLFLIVSL